jgi:hypothetical protein
MITKNFTEESIDFIFDHLWPQGEKELVVFGVSIDQARENYKAMINKPWTFAFYKTEESPCCAIAYLEPTGDMKWKSSFMATEEGFHSVWIGITKFLRRLTDYIIDKITEGKGVIELSTCAGSNVEWFSVIGFSMAATDGIIDQYIKRR